MSVRSAQMMKDLLVDAFVEFLENFLTWLIDYQYHFGAGAALMAIIGGGRFCKLGLTWRAKRGSQD